MVGRICSHCNFETERIPKAGLSKFFGRFIEIHKYRCQNPECNRETLFFPEFNQHNLSKLLLPYIITLGIPLLIVLVSMVLFAPQQYDQNPSQPNSSLNSNPITK